MSFGDGALSDAFAGANGFLDGGLDIFTGIYREREARRERERQAQLEAQTYNNAFSAISADNAAKVKLAILGLVGLGGLALVLRKRKGG